jgi:hypothetical protein
VSARPGGPTTSAELAPYEALLAHAEVELELAGSGDIERLAALAPLWQQLIAALPAGPPSGAAELIERATLMHERTRVELLRVRDALLAEMATVRRARETATGYARPTAPEHRREHNAWQA